MRTLGKKELKDIMVGCMYLGTGGGGNLEIGQRNLKNALEAGLKFELMDVADMGDDDYAAVPYDVGSLAIPGAPDSTPTKTSSQVAPNDGEEDTQTVAAFSALAQHMGKKFTAVIAGEIGAESTAASLIVAAKLKLVSLDADVVGRAAPEISQHSVLLAEGNVLPAAGVTKFKDVIILKEVSETSHEEDIFRSIAAASGYVSVADAPIPGSIAKKPGVLVTGSISLCQRIGAAYHEAINKKNDRIEAALKAGAGMRLFEGAVDACPPPDGDGGFTRGHVTIGGTDDNAGQQCVVQYQNENLIATVDGEVLAMVPDLITIVDRKSGMPIENPNYRKGQTVVVVGFPANPIWTTRKGLEFFGPVRFGLKHKYAAIAKLHKAFLEKHP